MIPLSHGLILSVILFLLGLFGVVIRQNLFFKLLSIEVMINAIAMSFIMGGSYWNQVDGQIMYILTITIAAVETSIGLILLIQLYRNNFTLYLK